MTQKFFLVAAGVCGLAISSHAELDPSLVAWYKFDEGAGATTAANAVSGSSSGTVSGNVTTGVSGISGNAYNFNSGDTATGFVGMGNASFFSSINTTQQMTLSAWVNTSITTGGRNVVVFAGNSGASGNYTDLGYSGTGDTANGANIPAGGAYARNRPTGNGINAPGTGQTSTVVNDGGWHNIVMTIDLTAGSNQLKLYVDGVLNAAQTLTAGNLAFPTLNNFNVGRLGRSSPTDYYSGLIDDVQVYNAALNTDQITYIFNNPGQALTVVPESGEVSVAIAAGLGVLIALRRKRQRNAA